MTRIARLFIALAIVLNLVAVTGIAQSRKTQSTAQPKATPDQKKPGSSTSSASRAENQSSNRTGASRDERELSASGKRDATKLQILNLTATPFSGSSVLAKANLKVDVPSGVELKGFDAVFEAQFSNGEIKTARSSSPASRLNVQIEFALPVISAPPFDCSICQNLGQLEKGEQEVRALQCSLNGCPLPPPQNNGGGKDKDVIRPISNSSNKTSISTRSSNGGLVLAELASLKVTVTAKFNDNASRGGFTKTEQKSQSGLQTKKAGTVKR